MSEKMSPTKIRRGAPPFTNSGRRGLVPGKILVRSKNGRFRCVEVVVKRR